MAEITISLFDWNPDADVSHQLTSILHINPDYVFQFNRNVRSGSPLHNKIRRFVYGCRGDLVIAIISSSCITPARLLLQYLNRQRRRIPVVIILEGNDNRTISDLLRRGAADFITLPLRAEEVIPRVHKILEHSPTNDGFSMENIHNLENETDELNDENQTTDCGDENDSMRMLIGKSSVFVREVNKIPFVAKCDSSVLIYGETGTGKEVFARAVHGNSCRVDKPFIPVSCAAIPTDLIENEFFGHREGAFTGAGMAKHGIIREAEGGTVLLDEIDSLPLLAQSKLLRFLQEKEYKRLGSSKIEYADVRIIAATNADLDKAVRQGKFRQDLYFRLNVIPLTLPALRHRGEDIVLLANHFIRKYCSKLNIQRKYFSRNAEQKLLGYSWPGNVRELEHVIERTVIFTNGTTIKPDNVLLPEASNHCLALTLQQAKTRMIADFEKQYIENLLHAHNGNISEAATVAGKNRRSFWELIRKHNIDAHHFRTVTE